MKESQLQFGLMSRSSTSACEAGGKRVGTRGHRLVGGEVRSTFPNGHEWRSAKQDFFALGALLHPLGIGSRCQHRGQILTLDASQKRRTSLLFNQTLVHLLFNLSDVLRPQLSNWGGNWYKGTCCRWSGTSRSSPGVCLCNSWK